MFSSLKKYFRKKQEVERFKNLSTEEVFTDIYHRNKWGDQESRSGKGSNLDVTTELRKNLPKMLESLSITSMLDIPCGDFIWMKEVDLPLVSYLGADIVAPLVDENQRRYGSNKRKFLHLNLLQDPLPEVDAIFCRECLVHFSFDDISKAINNIRGSGAIYLFTTQFPELKKNENIVTGKHRPLNFLLEPFNWPPPMMQFVELHTGKRRGNKCLSVWKIADLPK